MTTEEGSTRVYGMKNVVLSMLYVIAGDMMHSLWLLNACCGRRCLISEVAARRKRQNYPLENEEDRPGMPRIGQEVNTSAPVV